jgi:hypothetical protein
LSDEEILYVLSSYTDVYSAALVAVEHLIALYARLVSQGVGDLNISYSSRLDQYKALLGTLQARAVASGGALEAGSLYAGGILADEALDETAKAPAFTRTMHEYE